MHRRKASGPHHPVDGGARAGTDQLGERISPKALNQKLSLAQALTIPISRIKVSNRFRRDVGDVTSLADSIATIGLLHPVVATPDGTLIAGARRLVACQRLGWTNVPVNVVDLDEVVRGEFAENSYRKDFTLSEAVAIKRALEPLERAKAKERQGAGAKLAPGAKGKTRDKVASFTGVSHATLARAGAIVDAANAEPARFGKLLDDMN